MKVICEIDVRSFKFWGGAVDRVADFTQNDWDRLESLVSELFPEGIDETTLNDFVWFDFETEADLTEQEAE